jgi:RNA polymerase sigma-70 factor (ECF subfamily)
VEENHLIEALNTGNEEAFRRCVDLYQEKVLNTCYGFVHNRLDAEDLAQEVFIEVFRSVKRFKGNAKLSTWIYRIAVNKSLDFIRKKKRKKRFAILQSLFRFSHEGGEQELPVSEHPQSELERNERIRILNLAIDSLPQTQKAAITLSKYEGFSNREIAEILQTSVSAVESLLHRGRKNLYIKLHTHYEKNL